MIYNPSTFRLNNSQWGEIIPDGEFLFFQLFSASVGFVLYLMLSKDSNINKNTSTFRSNFDPNVLFIPFWVFGHFWRQSYENTKILRNLCLHFARQDGQAGKKPGKKITQLK